MKPLPCLVVLLLLPLFDTQAQAPAPDNNNGIAAPWDISQTVAALSSQTSRLKPLLDQVNPRDWTGAPDAYLAQRDSAQRELSDVQRVAQGLQKQPERLTLALDTYFRLQALELRLNTLAEGARRYQHTAIAEDLTSALGESATNREKLRDYISDLANEKEQEFTTVDREAQRCRTNLNRQPAPAPAPSKKK